MAEALKVRFAAGAEGVELSVSGWAGLRLAPLRTSVRIDGRDYVLRPERGGPRPGDGARTLPLASPDAPARIEQEWRGHDGGWRMASRLHVTADHPIVLNAVELLALAADTPVALPSPGDLCVLEQGRYWGCVVPYLPTEGSAEGASELVWVLCDRATGFSFLAAFETSRRWNGTVRCARDADGMLRAWSLGFDGGDLLLEPGEVVELEDVVLLAATEPLDLLDRYGRLTYERHRPDILAESPVTWCSWYPYRLGVSEERVLANARAAEERLRPLGLRAMVVDLGWERGWLPSIFEENDQFPHGLRGLADGLERLGFVLGTWCGPTSISAHDRLAVEHPEWLVREADGSPHASGEWFWEPHGQVYILDVTHPGAQGWLRDRIRSLAERGSRYVKADFVGNLASGAAKRRHDRRIVLGGGVEGGHLAKSIMRASLREAAARGAASNAVRPLFLSCGGPEMPGPGQADLIYTCDDTGNTGYVGWAHLQRVFLSTATHLFKHRRWGIVQPSCLCVGLPGTLAEARARATAAFLAGGQIDIGDNLTTLPEDRWHVLTATLPPQGHAAHAIDLFQPVRRLVGSYSTQGMTMVQPEMPPAPPASVWVLPVETAWDRWTLAAVFNYDVPTGDQPQLHTYVVPIDRLGLSADDDLWAYEFWSRQFCGCLPADPPPPPAYTHPGDLQMPVSRPSPETLAVSFFGPGVMLLAFRTRRPHPWVVGTGFHQSCGLELADVGWDASARVLSGIVHRPRGESGSISIAGVGEQPVQAMVDERHAATRPGARGSVVLPLVMANDVARWQVVLG